jgi:hypothetical protein
MMLAKASRMQATASPRHERRCLTVDFESNDTLMAPTSEGEMPKTAVILQSHPGVVNEIASASGSKRGVRERPMHSLNATPAGALSRAK